MIENIQYFFELFSLRLIIEDIKMVYSSGDIVDMAVYTVVLFFVGIGLLYVLSFLIDTFSSTKRKVLKFIEWNSADARKKRKAVKYKNEREAFENELKIKEQRKKDELARKEAEGHLNVQKKKELMEAEELIAFSEQDYSFFLPGNGYPNGPTLEHRLKLEEERIRQTEKRLLTDQERYNIRRGLSAAGTPFGSKEFQDIFSELWNNPVATNVVKGFSNTPINSNKKTTTGAGNVISFPAQKK